MTAPPFRRGQRVNVGYTGTLCLWSAGEIVVKDKYDEFHYYTPEAVTLTAGDPESWPPQVGDIWEADGYEYFVRSYANPAEPPMVIEPFRFNSALHHRYSDSWMHKLDEFKALSPVLVRRDDGERRSQ